MRLRGLPDQIAVVTANPDDDGLPQHHDPPRNGRESRLFQKIMVPVDLAHVEWLEKALDAAVRLARQDAIPICVVGVTPETPSPVAHTPREFEDKLAAYAGAQSRKHGVEIEPRAYASHDPTADLDKTLIAAAKAEGADLIVMASHVPGLQEHIFASHAGAVASHAEASVFVIR